MFILYPVKVVQLKGAARAKVHPGGYTEGRMAVLVARGGSKGMNDQGVGQGIRVDDEIPDLQQELECRKGLWANSQSPQLIRGHNQGRDS